MPEMVNIAIMDGRDLVAEVQQKPHLSTSNMRLVFSSIRLRRKPRRTAAFVYGSGGDVVLYHRKNSVSVEEAGLTANIRAGYSWNAI